MHDLTGRRAPLEYWFFRTEVDDLRLLVDLIRRRGPGIVETRVACTVGDDPGVSHETSPVGGDLSVGIASPSARIDASGTSGDSGGVRWDLAVELGPHRIEPVSAAFASTRPLDLLLLSRPAATFTGTIAAGGREWTLDAAPGMVAHYWGRALAPSWCWVSVVGAEGGPRLEATVLRSRLWGSGVILKGGYVWTWSGLHSDRPTLFSMPSNGSLISWSTQPSALRVGARRLARVESFSAHADASTFVPFGDGIRNSQRATVRWAGRELPGSLEFRDP